MIYEYDFGDSWLHEIVVEKILPDSGARYAVCLAGARACPPDDVGGPHGYALFLADRSNNENLDRWGEPAWVRSFDPERFDLPLINSRLT